MCWTKLLSGAALSLLILPFVSAGNGKLATNTVSSKELQSEVHHLQKQNQQIIEAIEQSTVKISDLDKRVNHLNDEYKVFAAQLAKNRA